MSSGAISTPLLKSTLTIGIAAVWFINGLFCKILHLVPRHEEIVSRILGESYAAPATRAIGFLELMMVGWILSGIRPAVCTWTQIGVVSAMVLLEAVLTPELLLFGRANMIPAGLFVVMVYLNGFVLSKTPAGKPFPGNTPVSRF
jgi:hypothetical protein